MEGRKTFPIHDTKMAEYLSRPKFGRHAHFCAIFAHVNKRVNRAGLGSSRWMFGRGLFYSKNAAVMKLHVLVALVCSCQAGVILQARNPDDIGGAIAFNNQDISGRYDFGYSEAHPSGATFRKESGDVYGNKYGSYGLRDADGRLRIVNYVADENGFRADVKTNEPGVAPQDPASITINRPAALQLAPVPPPPAVIAVPDAPPLPPPPPPKGIPFRYAAAVVQDAPPPKGLPFRYSAPLVRDIPIKGYPVPPPAYQYPDTFSPVVAPVPYANLPPKGYPVPALPYNSIQGKGYVSSFRNFAPSLPVALAPPQFPYYGGLRSLPNYQALGYPL